MKTASICLSSFLLAVVAAGCTQPSAPEDQWQPPSVNTVPATSDPPLQLSSMYLIEEPPEVFEFSFSQTAKFREDLNCVAQGNGFTRPVDSVAVTVWNRTGVVGFDRREFEPRDGIDMQFEFQVPDGPALVYVDSSCFGKVNVHGIERSAWGEELPSLQGSGQRNGSVREMDYDQRFEIVIPAGETSAVAEFTVGHETSLLYAWGTWHWRNIEVVHGNAYGNLSLYDPWQARADVPRSTTWIRLPNDDGLAYAFPPTMAPGTYRIVAELQFPAAEDTVWRIETQASHFIEENLVEWGFEQPFKLYFDPTVPFE